MHCSCTRGLLARWLLVVASLLIWRHCLSLDCVGGTSRLALSQVSQRRGSSCPSYGPDGCLTLFNTKKCKYSQCVTGECFTRCRDSTKYKPNDYLKCDKLGYGKCSQKHSLKVHVTKDCKVKVVLPKGRKGRCSCGDWHWEGEAGTLYGQYALAINVTSVRKSAAPLLPPWFLRFDGLGQAVIFWESSQACEFHFKVVSGPVDPSAQPTDASPAMSPGV